MKFLVEPVVPVSMDPFALSVSAECALECKLTCELDGPCDLICQLKIVLPVGPPQND